MTLMPPGRNLALLCLLLIHFIKFQNAYEVVPGLAAFVWARSNVVYSSAVLYKALLALTISSCNIRTLPIDFP